MKNIDFIEQELRNIKDCNNSYYEINVNEDYIKNMENIYRCIKALEIIKEKQVNVENLKICLSCKWEYELFEQECSDNNEYNELSPYKHSMTKEQFDLLKGVLL